MRASGGRSTLIVLTGPPCAGKTALAAALHRTVGGIRLDVDDIRLALLPTSNQREEDRNVAYSAMHLMVKHLIDGGVSTVVLAATYRRPGPRRQLADTVTGMAVDAFVVQCYVDGATAAERFTRRPPGHAAVDLTLESVLEAAITYPFADSAPIVDARRALDAMIVEVTAFVAKGQPTSLNAWIEAAGGVTQQPR